MAAGRFFTGSIFLRKTLISGRINFHPRARREGSGRAVRSRVGVLFSFSSFFFFFSKPCGMIYAEHFWGGYDFFPGVHI